MPASQWKASAGPSLVSDSGARSWGRREETLEASHQSPKDPLLIPGEARPTDRSAVTLPFSPPPSISACSSAVPLMDPSGPSWRCAAQIPIQHFLSNDLAWLFGLWVLCPVNNKTQTLHLYRQIHVDSTAVSLYESMPTKKEPPKLLQGTSRCHGV